MVLNYHGGGSFKRKNLKLIKCRKLVRENTDTLKKAQMRGKEFQK